MPYGIKLVYFVTSATVTHENEVFNYLTKLRRGGNRRDAAVSVATGYAGLSHIII